jgi:tRNA (cmo5U34)-methyltransferase
MDTRDIIDAQSTETDAARRCLIPCFDELHGALLCAIPQAPDNGFSVLDMGAGTGFLSSLVLRRFPRAHVTLVDVDSVKLDAARERLSEFEARTSFVSADFARVDPEGAFDLIVAAFSMHHVSNLDKRAIYRTLYSHLNRNGTLVVADRLKGPTPELDSAYKSHWENEARALGTTEDDLERSKEHWRDDHVVSLSDHLEWIANSGFRDIDVSYKNMMFAVFGGHRPDF